MGDENPIRTLGDYSKPSHEGYRNTIELPEGNNVLAIGLNAFQQDPSPQGGSYYPIPCSILSTRKDRKTPQQYPDAPTTSWIISIRSMDSQTIDQSAGGKLRDLNPEESWAILEDLALYDNESWNNPRDFPKLVKAITLPQDVPSTSDRRLIELENQVQCLMEAYLASTQLTQMNKITASYEICNGPHDTHNCTKGLGQACVDHASSHTDEIRGRSYQIKLEKALLDFDSSQEKRLSHLRTQLEQHQDDMIGKINLLWKTVSEKLNDISTSENAGNSMAHKTIATISHDEKEDIKKKGIKSPSKLLSGKYLSPASIKELNKNPSAPKHVHFVNSIVILSTDSDTDKEDTFSNSEHEHELDNMVRRSEGVKEQGKEDDETETDMVVEEVIDEEESEFETDEEVEEVFKEDEKDEDDESFNSFLTMKELSHYEWLLKHPRPPWVKAKEGEAYKIFIGSFTYECDFMILEDTSSIIDRHLGEMIFGKPFIDETDLVYNEEKGTIMFKQGDVKITFKMPYTMEVFRQTWLMGLSTDSIPPSAHEENFGYRRTHNYQSLLIGDEYKQDEGDRKGIRHLMRLEKEMMDNKGEVT
ncbi:hypothetical protein Tco_1525629 [Tanacetum coccineum]